MAKRFAAALFAGLLTAVCASGQGNPPTRTRVTIRSEAGNVVIERSQTTAPAPKPSGVPDRIPGPLDTAADMKTAGASDADLLAYLRAHAAELPQVIDAEDIHRLRKAGAGRSIVGYLASLSAVEIGETGEGNEAPAGIASAPAPDSEFYSSGAPYYEAFVGGYYPSYAPGFMHPRFPSHNIHRGKHTGSPRGRPAFQAGAHARAAFSRLPAPLRRQR
jgi:hypothetical protein